MARKTNIFVTAVLTIAIITCVKGQIQNEVVNCSQYSFKKLPELLIYDASTDEPDYKKEFVLLRKPSQSKYPGVLAWPGFECYHDKAIRLVYNLDIKRASIGDSFSAITREAEDFYNTSSYRFKAESEIQVPQNNLHFLVSCMAYGNLCERRMAEVVYNDTGVYVIRSVPEQTNNETRMKIQELEDAVQKSQNYWSNIPQIEEDACEITFDLFDEGNKIFHGFIPKEDDIKPQSFPDRQSLENAHLFDKHLSPTCIRTHCRQSKGDESPCFVLPKFPARLTWPLLFFTESHSRERARVVHAYRTVATRNYTFATGENNLDELEEGPEKIDFPWVYTDRRNFLGMGKLPKRVYYNESVNIICQMAPFIFALGAKIAYKFDNQATTSVEKGADKLIFLREEDIRRPDENVGAIKATGELLFPSRNFTEPERTVTVFCFAPIFNSSTEWVNVSRKFILTTPSLDVRGSLYKTLFHVSPGSSFSTKCFATGTPFPRVEVITPLNNSGVNITETVKNDTVHTEISILSFDESHVGFYNCVASNPRGTFYYEFELRKSAPSKNSAIGTLSIILISVFGTISAIFLAIVVILLVRFRLEKEEFRRLTEEAVREFQNGLEESKLPTAEDESGQVYANDSVKTRPYERKFEVSQKNWTISNSLLGSGAYGVVRRGTVEIGSRKSIVAVKTVKSPDDIDNFRATLLELKIMEHVGHHRHIVKLIAASTEEIHNRKVLIGVEFCANGSLLSYLQKRKKLFNNFVQDGQIKFPPKDKEKTEPDEDGPYENLIVTSDISTIDLYKWSYQIASGMDYLESKKVLHADLAARNILLTEELVVKISDFGMSRDLFENSEYTKKTQVFLPWKHMAPESLKYLKFSTKSDVWSLGVTYYEVFTLGEEPYPGQSWSDDFVQALENGIRLEKPEFCTNNLYSQVMMPCWRAEPSERISFADAMAFFKKAIGLLTSSPRRDDECREFC